jgi:hypothetical protein
MKNVITQLRLASLLSLILLACTAAYGQLTPLGDSYTNTAAATTNYGAKTLLDVESSQTTFIQFDLSSIPASYTSADIAKATLKLYVNAVTTAGSFNVDYVNGAWTESKIDASNAPALGTTIAASVPLVTADKNQYILIDVTAAVQAWLSGTANDGIALVGNSPLNASFDSKESTSTSHAPELDIVYAGIAGVTTASGSGLIGGGTSGTLNLALTNTCATNQVLQWNGTSWVCAAVGTGTVTSVGSGTGLTGGPITGSGTLSLDTTKVPLLAAANTFTANQTVNGTLSATGVLSGSVGIGTTAPTHALEVSSAGATAAQMAMVSSGSDAAFSLKNTASGGREYWIDSGSGGAGVGAGNFAVYDRTAGLTRLVVNSLGNVGIGTTAPSAALQVFAWQHVPGGNFTGFTAPSGSDLFGTDGVDATGGNGDPNPSDFGFGGNGVVGTGGTGSDGDGLGGFFTGGNSAGGAGDGVDAYAGSGYAGAFQGDIWVSGKITAGTKDFKIDHPLDPANKYLVHASVESSEMMNIYTGNVVTDSEGHATVQLPEWFEVLNTDFRYQLTVIGQFAQAIIGRKIENNQFGIRTSVPNVEVSWQVTGVRQDAYAKANPLVVEQEKEARLRGFYIHPELYGAPAEKQIEWARHPQTMKRMKEMRAKQQLTIKAAAQPVAAQPK